MKTAITSIHGSAMLIALWAVAVTAFAVTTAVVIVQRNQEETTALHQMFQIRQAAESGLMIALHPQVAENDPLLHGRCNQDVEYHAQRLSEGARLNINQLLKEAGGKEILRRLFKQWGLGDSDLSILASSLEDWVDDDDFTKLNGAEYEYYQKVDTGSSLPRNRPFQNVDEMKQVRGIEALQAQKPDWDLYFTTWSDGKLDLNDAPEELIAAVCRVGNAQAGALVEAREEIKKNPDPEMQRWKDVTPPLTLMGLTSEQMEAAREWTTVTAKTWRIISTGRRDKKQCTVVAVVQGEGERQRTLYRDEL